MHMLKKVAVVVSIVAFAGCAVIASNSDALARETAKSIGGGIPVEKIAVSNVDRGITTVKWQADTPQGSYSCSADDMMHSTYCAKK
jgi:hypothetical protein